MIERETLLAVLAILRQRRILAEYKVVKDDTDGYYAIHEITQIEEAIRKMLKDLIILHPRNDSQ
jgi:DNA polymerase elongation subunit (family B)